MKYEYKDWEIERNPKPIPMSKHDIDVTHKDYDGSNDLHFTCSSMDEAIRNINDRCPKCGLEINGVGVGVCCSWCGYKERLN